MLNRTLFIQLGIILTLVLLQVYVFNHIQFLGLYNPFIFIAYILFLPARMPFNQVLIFSFILGLTMDLFMGTPGVNAFCSIFTVLLRELFLHRIFSKSEDSYLEISDLNFLQLFIYILSLSLFYNLMLYSLESFNSANLLYNLQEGLLNGMVSFVGISLLFLIFKNRIGA